MSFSVLSEAMSPGQGSSEGKCQRQKDMDGKYRAGYGRMHWLIVPKWYPIATTAKANSI